MDFNEILVKKLTGQVLTSDERAILIANADQLANIAKEVTSAKTAEQKAAEQKAAFDAFFAELKNQTFDGLSAFNSYVKEHAPKTRKSGTGNGTTEVTVYSTLQDALNAPKGYPQAVATALSKKSPQSETDLCKVVEGLLPDNSTKYTLSRVRYHTKHQLPFVSFIKEGDYSLVAPTPAPEK